MAENPSSLREHPQTLEGPRLLHALINWQKYQQLCAIDFTSHERRQLYTYRDVQVCTAALSAKLYAVLHPDTTKSLETQDFSVSLSNEVVPILIPQSPGLYISQLAILQSGAAFCPINLDAPEDRIKFVITDVSAKLIITTSEYEDLVSWDGGPDVIVIDKFPEIPHNSASFGTISPFECSSKALAYVMYTSGSSGTPKGVAVSHLAVSQSLLAHERHIPVFERFLQFAAPSFDVSIFEIFFPLMRGATLVGCNRTQLLNDLPGKINELVIDAAELTPTVVGSLIQTKASVPGLQLLLTIGEMLTRPIIQEFGGSKDQKSILYGMYGPTEAAIHCTIHPKMQSSAAPGNIGVPFDTVSTFIAAPSSVDGDSIRFLSVEEWGELVLSGPQLAQCYLNREKQNKAAFITYKDTNYYRTGDKARLLTDGTIEMSGRISSGQVKIRGQRVELGEIEEVIYKHPGIKTVAAMVIGKILVVFALTNDQEMRSEDVITTCEKWLPRFMIPNEIIILNSFHYLPSGKVDKRKLEAKYEESRKSKTTESSAGNSDMARSVTDVVKGLLGDFPFDMRLAAAGLDSLTSIRVASQLKSLGFKVTTLEVLQAENLTSLILLCKNPEQRDEKSKTTSVIIPSDTLTALNDRVKDLEYSVRCTPLQHAMLFETIVKAEAYRNWVLLKVSMKDIKQICSAIHSLANQNQILRTGFIESNNEGDYVQVIWKNLKKSQVREVDSLDFSTSTDSLQHPFSAQACLSSDRSYTKVLLHLHHAVYDAWSLELLLDDLDLILAGDSLSQRTPFNTFVQYYFENISTLTNWSVKDYWKDHLAQLEPQSISNYHTRKTGCQGLKSTSLSTSISTSAVERLAKSNYISPQTLLQAVYAVILGSYLGSSDICFASIFSGRTLPIDGIEQIVGPCFATLPLRIDTAAHDTLIELAKALNKTNRAHLENSMLPLREIKTASGIKPGEPIFDTLFVWQQTLHELYDTRKQVTLEDSLDNLEFKLTIEITPTPSNIKIKANYDSAVFALPQINILLSQIESLASAMIIKETVKINEVFCCLGSDLLSIHNEYPETKLKFPNLTLFSPVETIAKVDPDRAALDFMVSTEPGITNTQRLSYYDLNSRANKIGRFVLGREIFPDELVCICMDKCIDLYVTILAISKVGAGYLPVTPETPLDRLQNILSESKARMIVGHLNHRSVLDLIENVEVIYLDTIDEERLSSENLPSRFNIDNLAYSVFTSGSTGAPKGVLVTQGNMLSNLEVLRQIYPADHNSRLLQACSAAFDVSVFEIFFTWSIGACICSTTKDILFGDVEKAIRSLDVTHLSLTPTVAALIDPRNTPKVEFLVTAGEALTQKVFQSWSSRGLYQGYGPSETTNICTINPALTELDIIPNIGLPLSNTSAFVLSPQEEFSLVPKGGEGEFCFGGMQVFRGYLNKDQESGRLIEHPNYGRLYRSGDYGRMMFDGSLLFTSRKDDQVKIRGQRVELGEINSLLLAFPKVKDVFSFVVDDAQRASQQLICFWAQDSKILGELCCLEPEIKFINQLYSILDSKLPSYMIPSALIPISYLPQTIQGKIDKQTLTQLYSSLGSHYLNSVARVSENHEDKPLTDLELKISRAVQAATKRTVKDIGRETSFFSIGIDSISAITLARNLKESTGQQVNISDILKFHSVIRLASQMQINDNGIKALATSESLLEDEFGFDQIFTNTIIDKFKESGKTVESIFPCTPLQEAILSAAETSLDSLYSNEVVLNITGDMSTLASCWQEMTRRHEILRTYFLSTENTRYPYVQVVLTEYELKIPTIQKFRRSTQQATTNQRNTDKCKKFTPPYSLSFLESAEKTQLIIHMHHALYDGVALSILYNEVEKLYQEEKLPAKVDSKPFLKHIHIQNLKESDTFWESLLKNIKPTLFQNLDSLKQGPQKENSIIEAKSFEYSLSWVEQNLLKYETTLLAICHTAWTAVLAKYFRTIDVCFGNVISGRTADVENIERLVAPCFNTVPVRLQDSKGLSYLEAFRYFQTLNADSLPFQFTPLRRIQSRFSPTGTRLFETLFILQQSPRRLNSMIWEIETDHGAIDFPLVIEVTPEVESDSLKILLHFNRSIISTEVAYTLIDSFLNNVQTALQNPRRPLIQPVLRDSFVAQAAKTSAEPSKDSKLSQIDEKEMSSRELEIRDIIARFTNLPIASIGIHTTIFRIGLDSISTVQVASILRKRGYTVLAGDILEHPTISDLAEFLIERESIKDHSHKRYNFTDFEERYGESIYSANDIISTNVECIRPCTPVQQGMIAQSLHSAGKDYINSVWLELSQDVSLEQLEMAWNTVCQRHEILRAVFVETGDINIPFSMVIYKKEMFSLPWKDHRARSASHASFDEYSLQRPWSLEVCTKDQNMILKFTAHHALYDAQSIQMIYSDVQKVYNSQKTPIRPPISLLLESILINSEDNLEKKSFWDSEENKIIINRFPNLNPLFISSDKISIQEVDLGTSISKLENLCRDQNVTVQAAIQATWGRLLAAYIGESTTTFGITLSGRSVYENADTTSFPSIVTLPTSCNIIGSNRELLSRVMRFNAQLSKHQFTPLTLIKKWSGYSESQLFDTLITYQKLPDMQASQNKIWGIICEESNVDYSISLEVQPIDNDQAILRMTSRDSLIPPEQVKILLAQYSHLLLDTLSQPESRCDTVPHIRSELLSVTPPKERELHDSVSLLHQYVERGARSFPDRVALEFTTRPEGDGFICQSWTYKDVDNFGNRVAQLVIKHGVQPGDIVAICFDKCPEASFAIIGIMKAGCAYVALDPNAPADRLNFVIKDSGANLVLSAERTASHLKETLVAKIIQVDIFSLINEHTVDPVNLAREIGSQDVSYCLYTSGTTGTPKGCLITHENAVQAMLAFQRLFSGHWTTESKWLQFASFHFDVSLLEQFWSWSVGICVATAPRDLIFEDLPGTIQRLGITHIDLTPSLARLLHPSDVPSLCKGVFITGGEQLKQEILDIWGEYGCIYNGYGPTEATIGVTMFPRVPRNGKPSNIGPQFDNVGSFVLRPGTSIPVLRGGVGELCVSGKLVGKGYLNRDDLTKEKFPFLDTFNERVYRTGDLVRILHDGTFIFLGRADDQVKLRGQRLELGEINEVIKKSQACLDEVVTLVLKHPTQQKEQLVTFFSFAIGVTPLPNHEMISEMKSNCKAKLPGYMIPTYFIPVETFPLNPNNKADSKQLAAIFNTFDVEELQNLTSSNVQYRSWTDDENSIIITIADYLNVEKSVLTPESNIFELGLDSISIIGFARRLQLEGYSNAKLSIVKDHPQISELIQVLLLNSSLDYEKENAYILATQNIVAFSQKHMSNICKDLYMNAQDIECLVPCTPVQEGIIYRFLEAESALYFNKFRFDLEKDLNTTKLLAAWNRVISRLQILRTRFIATIDGFAQVVLKEFTVSWNDPNFNYSSVDKQDALKSPIRLSIESHLPYRFMVLDIFHGLYDGNSLPMIFDLLIREYHDEKEISYGPSFQSVLPYGPLFKAPHEKLFWESHLKQWAYQPLLAGEAGSKNILIQKTFKDMKNFEKIRKALGIAPLAIIQAVWLSALQILFVESQLTIGLILSGRSIDFNDSEKIVGPLFNTVPFSVNMKAIESLRSLAKLCHKQNVEMQNFQHSSLADIQRWSPAGAGDSLFNSLFVFQRAEAPSSEKSMWTILDDEPSPDYPLAFEATLDDESKYLKLVIVAEGDAISQIQAEELLSKFELFLQSILADSKEVSMVKSAIEKEPKLNSSSFPNNLAKMSKVKARIENGISKSPFSWTEEAAGIRSEIASLADIFDGFISENSSVFELGLDSIDMIKLSSRLRKRNIQLSVSNIIKLQTIANMVEKLPAIMKQDQNSPSGRSIQEMSQELTNYLSPLNEISEDIEYVLPGTPLQQSMFNEMTNSGYKRYFNIEAFKIHNGINISKLRHAINQVIDQSPILRTTFVKIDNPKSQFTYAQLIHKKGGIYVNKIVSDYSSVKETLFEGIYKQFEADSINEAIKGGQQLRISLISRKKSSYLMIAISHALYDGRSIRSVHQDIHKAFMDISISRPDPLPFLEQVFRSSSNSSKEFWRSSLANIPTATLPKKTPSIKNEAIATYRSEYRSTVPLQDIENLSKKARVSIQTIGQTCWAILLSSLMCQLDVIFGTVLSCRDSEEADEVMFPLMNTVAIRSVIHGSMREMLTYMQSLNDNARQYQHFPLGVAQSLALSSRSSTETRHASLFDTLFIYQGRRVIEGQDPLYTLVSGTSEVEFSICVEMEIIDDEFLSWTAACKSDSKTATETQELVSTLDKILQKLTKSIDEPMIMSGNDGVSVYGLPEFKMKSAQPSGIPAQAFKKDTEWSETEKGIRKSLHEISGIPEEKIFKSSTIFHLGLDSILILKLPALLKTYGINLGVSDILRDLTITSMARTVLEAKSQDKALPNIDLAIENSLAKYDLHSIMERAKRIGEVDYIMPITPGQHYMIRRWQASKGQLFYATFTYHVKGMIDKTKLESSWSLLQLSHDILRTGFYEADDSIVQVVFKNILNPVITTESVTAEARNNLETPPLILCLEFSEQSGVILRLSIHHALYDGISLPLLVDELRSLYESQDAAAPNKEFKNFVGKTIAASQSTKSGSNPKENWIKYFLQQPENSILNLEYRANLNSSERIELFRPSLKFKPLKEAAQTFGVSIDAIFLASISKVYARWQLRDRGSSSHPSETVFGIYLANRAPHGEDLSYLAAPTLSLLPLRISNSLDRDVFDVAKDIQHDLRKISQPDMSSASLRQIYEWTGVRVELFVNILKNSNSSIRSDYDNDNRLNLESVLNLRERTEINGPSKQRADDWNFDTKHSEAYLPSIDLELRYHLGENEIDIGLFGPHPMISAEDAEWMIREIVGYLG